MEYTGSGDIVCIPFNTDIAANPDFATLADGTYRADTTGGDGSHAKHTFDAGKQGVAYIMARYATSPAKSNHIRYGRRLRPHRQRRLQRRPPGQRLSRILSIKFVVHISTKI